MNHQCATTQSVCPHDARKLNGAARAIAIEIQHISPSYPTGLWALIRSLSTPFFINREDRNTKNLWLVKDWVDCILQSKKRCQRIWSLTLLESSGLSDKWTTEPGCVFIVLERNKGEYSWSRFSPKEGFRVQSFSNLCSWQLVPISFENFWKISLYTMPESAVCKRFYRTHKYLFMLKAMLGTCHVKNLSCCQNLMYVHRKVKRWRGKRKVSVVFIQLFLRCQLSLRCL